MPITVFMGLVFLAWFLLSVATQFRFRRLQWIKSRDYCAILPSWTFFAPNPGVTDFTLVYRELWANGGCSDWREIDLGGRTPIVSALWNPNKRKSKVLVDATCELMKYAAKLKDEDTALVAVSAPYIIFLNLVTTQALSPFCECVQFAIMKQYGPTLQKATSPSFSSGLHRV